MIWWLRGQFWTLDSWRSFFMGQKKKQTQHLSLLSCTGAEAGAGVPLVGPPFCFGMDIVSGGWSYKMSSRWSPQSAALEGHSVLGHSLRQGLGGLYLGGMKAPVQVLWILLGNLTPIKYFIIYSKIAWGLQTCPLVYSGLDGKRLHTMRGDRVQSWVGEDPLRRQWHPHSGLFAWKSMDRGAW